MSSLKDPVLPHSYVLGYICISGLKDPALSHNRSYTYNRFILPGSLSQINFWFQFLIFTWMYLKNQSVYLSFVLTKALPYTLKMGGLKRIQRRLEPR